MLLEQKSFKPRLPTVPLMGTLQCVAIKRKRMSVKNVFDKITSFENLLNAEKEVGSGKKGQRNEVLLFREDLENNLFELQEHMLRLTHPKAYYNIFYVYEPKVRKVIDIDYRNKIIQRAIYDVINPLICKGFITDTYSCVEGRGQLRAAQRLHDWMRMLSRKPGRWYYLKIDIAKFFYRIPHDILCKTIDKKIGDRRAAALIKSYIQDMEIPFGLPLGADPQTIPMEEMLWDRGIPIGGGLSHMLANMYLDKLDQYCKRELQIECFIRYMDDTFALADSKEKLQEWKAKISTFLLGIGLVLNNKTAIRPINSGAEFVGVIIWPTHMTIRKSTSLRMKRRLNAVRKDYKEYKVTFKRVTATVSSYKGLLKHFNCSSLEKKIFEEFVLTHDKETIHAR